MARGVVIGRAPDMSVEDYWMAVPTPFAMALLPCAMLLPEGIDFVSQHAVEQMKEAVVAHLAVVELDVADDLVNLIGQFASCASPSPSRN